MLAPLPSLSRAASRARRTLHDSIESAEQLAEESARDHVPDVHGDETEQSPEDLDPDDARERVEDVYEPLMGNGRAPKGGEEPESKVRTLEVRVFRLRMDSGAR